MNRIPLVLMLAAATMLSACSGATKSPTIDAPPSTLPENAMPDSVACDPIKAQWAIGKNGDAALLTKAQADAGAEVARFLHPNQPITMEYNHSRLNVLLDANGRVDKVSCG